MSSDEPRSIDGVTPFVILLRALPGITQQTLLS
jgi:hypothetical protein